MQRMRIPRLALAAALIMAVISGSARAERPVGSWPACDELRTTFCIRSFTVNGESMLGSESWRLEAWILVSDNGVDSFNWAVEQAGEAGWGVAGDPRAVVSFSLNTGDIEPLMTVARASNLSLLRGGDAEGGYTMSVEAQPISVQWKFSSEGGDCGAGDCGDETTQADISQVVLMGNTQNMNMWSADERTLFAGIAMATDAQFSMLPLFGAWPAPHWLIQVGNPHLAVDGSAVVGEYSAQIPPNLLEAMGVTQDEAVAAGIEVIRVAGGESVPLEAAVMGTADGGLYIRIPALAYSAPQLEFSGAAGLKTALSPDAPRKPGATALDGAAVVRFRPPFFDGGARVGGYTVSCRAGGVVSERRANAAVEVELTGLANGVEHTCRVRARNSAGTGRASYAVSVTPIAGAAPIPPGAPPRVNRSVDTQGVLNLDWMLPRSTGGAPLVNYVVDICPAGAACPANSVLRMRPIERAIQVQAGVLPPGRYVALVRARNGAGLGSGTRSAGFSL